MIVRACLWEGTTSQAAEKLSLFDEGVNLSSREPA
jgi:hypothetical protein